MSSKQLFGLTGQTEIVNGDGSRLTETKRAYVGKGRCKRCSMFASHRGLRESCERDQSIRETSTCPGNGCNRS